MAQKTIGVIMNGVSGRMGYRQHLVRSVLAIREQGGVLLSNGDRVQVEPILVGRREAVLAELARKHDIADWTTDLDAALADPRWEIYADFLVTKARAAALRKAIAAGEVHDKLYLPGLRKLARLVESGFFGRILSVRGEFGYWVFEGDWQPAQRPSWNYREEDGGGIIVDMLCHWRYVLDNLFGEVKSVSCLGATHIPERWDENGEPYEATADDAAYSTFELAGGVVAHINSSWCVRVNRDELFELQVDGTQGSAVAGLRDCKAQHGENTPKAVWNPDLPDTNDYRSQWLGVPEDEDSDNAFKIQWEMFLRYVAADEPFPYDLLEGAKGVQLAELGLRSWRERRWLEVPALESSRTPQEELGHA